MFGVTYAFLWLLVLLQGFGICVLVRQLSELQRRADRGRPAALVPLPLGSTAPDFSAIDLSMSQHVHSSVFRGRRRVLLFLSTDCSVCRKLASELSRTAAGALEGLILYCQGNGRACQSYFSPLVKIVPVLARDAVDVAATFRLAGFPVAVMLDEEWRVTGFRYPSHYSQILDCLSSDDRVPSSSAAQPI